MSFYVYLSGEIHTSWREEIIAGAQEHQLDIVFTGPVTNHEASDAAGDMLSADIGNESSFWRDHQSAKVNAMPGSATSDVSDETESASSSSMGV